MKKLTTIISAIAFGLALFQPMAASAKDKDQKEKGKGRQGNSDNRQQSVQQPRASAPVARSKGGQGRAQSVNVQQGNGGRDRARSVQNQTQNARSVQSLRYAPSGRSSAYSNRGSNNYSNHSSYTRSNNYGGLWVHGDRHRDWNRNSVHVWGDHRYRWYDGGWLIIDGGYEPTYYSHADTSGSSIVQQVQRRLTVRGYPSGYADGVIGPATRRAIADYQRDNGLSVTGRINESLLASMGLD